MSKHIIGYENADVSIVGANNKSLKTIIFDPARWPIPVTINDRAFIRCSVLSNVENATAIRIVGDWAFAYSKIKNISFKSGRANIPNQIVKLELGNYIFYHCSLQTVTFNVYLSYMIVQKNTFRGCYDISIMEYDNSDEEAVNRFMKITNGTGIPDECFLNIPARAVPYAVYRNDAWVRIYSFEAKGTSKEKAVYYQNPPDGMFPGWPNYYTKTVVMGAVNITLKSGDMFGTANRYDTTKSGVGTKHYSLNLYKCYFTQGSVIKIDFLNKCKSGILDSKINGELQKTTSGGNSYTKDDYTINGDTSVEAWVRGFSS